MPGQRASLAILILVEAAAFGYMSETVAFPTAVAMATLLGWRGQWRYQLSQDRQVIIALIAAVLFVVTWRVQPHSLFDDAMDYLSPFLHSLGQFLLALQMAALYLHYDDDVLPITLPWPGVFVMISAGDVTIGRDSTQRVVFQLLALAFTAATALFFAATARSTSGTQRQSDGVGKLGVATALLAVTVFVAGLAATALHRYEDALNRLVGELLNPTMSSSSAGFPNRAQIGSVARRKNERSQDIALRVYSNGEPGYLRGKGYHWLTTVNGHFGETTQWKEAPLHSSMSETTDLVEERLESAETDGDRFRFDLRNPPGGEFQPVRSMDVWLEGSQWGVYFLPPHTVEILSQEDTIRRDYRQVTSGTDTGNATYTVHTGPRPDDVVFPGSIVDDGALSRKLLTAVPDRPDTAGSDREIRELADRIFQNCTSVDEHVSAVENYFQTNYGYAVGIDPPAREDPLRWFLKAKPSAHCEYFAQGAAFLLRLRRIPTRYMTGFVVAERNEYGDFWLARNAHAHAWCEAWDDDRGWVIVEATPSAGVPSETSAPKHRQMWEYLSGRVEQFRYRFSEGGWTWLLRQVLAFLATPAGWVVIALVIAYVVIRWRMRRSSRAGPTVPPLILEMNRLLARMDRRLSKAGVSRKPGETLSHFAQRVEAETGDSAIATWYADYAASRYRGPDPDAVASLSERVKHLGTRPRRVRDALAAETA
ncbi:MAG: transglutaminase domain-containing protein [Planctomycetaceae bacterium]